MKTGYRLYVIYQPRSMKAGYRKKLEPGSTRTGYTLHLEKPVFKAGRFLTRIFKFYSQVSRRNNRGNQFFWLELEIKDEILQNTRFRTKKGD